MISIDKARSLILQQTWRNEPVRRPLQQSVNQVLAESVTSDIDSPPHDKSLVDGYAIIATDVQGTETNLEVIEQVTAGEVPSRTVRPGMATRIMTGAPIPSGADAVVMIEQTELVEGPAEENQVRIGDQAVEGGQNIMCRGTSIRRGEVVLESGHEVRATDVGLLCEVGRTRVRVVRPPRVAILATGNELVPPGFVPQAGRIRNTNGPMLCSMVRAAQGEPVNLGICPDDRDALHEVIQRGLRCDVLILSGGVSAGVLDLVPSVLDRAGVRQVFHKVRLKPGKPLWFGTYESSKRKTLVFGLPGNPVGSLVCFELFVRPTLRRIGGRKHVVTDLDLAQLARPHDQRGDRPTYFPAMAKRDPDGRLVVTPVRWMGSADQRAVGGANCLAFFPPGDQSFAAGQAVEILWLEASC